MMYKLPILKIIIEAFWYSWKYKLQFIYALALPVVLVVSISAVWSELGTEIPFLNWSFFIIYFLSISFYAISCHRFILMGADNKAQQPYVLIMKRIIIFSILGVFVYLLAGIPFWLILTITMNILPDDNLVSSSHNLTADNFNWVKLVLMLPFGYLVGRLSLVLPATAVDIPSSFKWSWQATKNNGVRMLVLIGVLPWLITVLLDLLWRENGTMFEYVFLSMLGYLVVAVEIFILSLAFKELYRQKRDEGLKGEE